MLTVSGGAATPQRCRIARRRRRAPVSSCADRRLVRVELLARRRGRERAQAREVAEREVEHALLLRARAGQRRPCCRRSCRPASACRTRACRRRAAGSRAASARARRSTTCGASRPRACRRGCRTTAAATRSAGPAARSTARARVGRCSGPSAIGSSPPLPGYSSRVRAPVSISTVPRSWPPPTEPDEGRSRSRSTTIRSRWASNFIRMREGVKFVSAALRPPVLVHGADRALDDQQPSQRGRTPARAPRAISRTRRVRARRRRLR